MAHADAFLSAGATRHWHVIDLGTLGGPFSEATAINNKGDIAGSSRVRLGSPQRHCFVWSQGKMRDIGALPGARDCFPIAINDRGDVAGNSGGLGFFWRDGRMVDLGSLGMPHVEVASMNADGAVVGRAWTGDRYPRAFVWRSGRLTALPEPAKTSASWAISINDRGDIAGNVESKAGPGKAVQWLNGNLQVLPSLPGGDWTSANDMNRAGEVVGASWDSHVGGDGKVAVYWHAGRVTRLPAPVWSEARLIAADGTTIVDTETGWYLFRNGRLRRLPAPSDASVPGHLLNVKAINTHLVAGERDRAFVVRLGIFRWLPGGISDVYAVNGLDQIVGTTRVKGAAISGGYPSHAALWKR